jgi:hypothetical protein
MKLGQAWLLSDVSTRFLQDPRALDHQEPSSSKQVHVTASLQVAFAFVRTALSGFVNALATKEPGPGLGLYTVPPGTAVFSRRPALSHPRLLGSLRTLRHMSFSHPRNGINASNAVCALARSDAGFSWAGPTHWVSPALDPWSSHGLV